MISLGEASLLQLLRLADSALPVGTFVHSFGLEASIAAGRVRDAQSLAEMLRADLHLRVVPGDFRLLRSAYDAAGRGEVDGLIALDGEIEARQVPREVRDANRQTGWALLKLVRATRPGEAYQTRSRFELSRNVGARHAVPSGRARHASPLHGKAQFVPARSKYETHHNRIAAKWQGIQWIVAFAAAAVDLGIPFEAAACAYAYSHLASRISCAVRLIPLGQTEGQKVLTSLLGDMERLGIPEADRAPSDFAGIMDICSMQHERQDMRIFRS